MLSGYTEIAKSQKSQSKKSNGSTYQHLISNHHKTQGHEHLIRSESKKQIQMESLSDTSSGNHPLNIPANPTYDLQGDGLISQQHDQFILNFGSQSSTQKYGKLPLPLQKDDGANPTHHSSHLKS